MIAAPAVLQHKDDHCDSKALKESPICHLIKSDQVPALAYKSQEMKCDCEKWKTDYYEQDIHPKTNPCKGSKFEVTKTEIDGAKMSCSATTIKIDGKLAHKKSICKCEGGAKTSHIKIGKGGCTKKMH